MLDYVHVKWISVCLLIDEEVVVEGKTQRVVGYIYDYLIMCAILELNKKNLAVIFYSN